jgi:hypothetical protein
MYVNAKMIPVETVPGIRGWRREVGGEEIEKEKNTMKNFFK